MQIRVNDEPFEVQPETTILQYLGERNIDEDQVLVAKNGTIVYRQKLGDEKLEPDDELEILEVVVGG